MRILVLLTIIVLLVSSCASEVFTFTVTTTAKVLGNTHEHIAISYDIYGKTVFQDIHLTKHAELSYYRDQKEFPIEVTVKGDNLDGRDRIFLTIRHKGNLIGEAKVEYKGGLSIADFMYDDLKIEGFTWLKYNEKEYSGGISAHDLRAELADSDDEKPEEKAKKVKNDKPKNNEHPQQSEGKSL